jgi:hypothetical protein
MTMLWRSYAVLKLCGVVQEIGNALGIGGDSRNPAHQRYITRDAA